MFKPKKSFFKEKNEGGLGRIALTWKKYGFPGRPPVAGGEAEEKLLRACEKYVESVLKMEAGKYENSRRDLHNRIAMIVYGKRRESLDNEAAEKLSNFASEIILGKTIKGALLEVLEKREKAA